MEPPVGFWVQGPGAGLHRGREDRRHLVGPHQQPGLPLLHTSRIGLVPKSDPNQWQLIVDLSFSFGHSVNDDISSELSSISYASVDDAVQHICDLGRMLN